MSVDELVDQHVENALSDALTIVREILTTNTNSTVERSRVSLRCRYRSSSNHRNERKLSFYHTIPRCSLPSTKNDLIDFQTRRRTTRDVLYSFSLQNSSWSNQIYLQPIRNFAQNFTEEILRSAVKKVEDERIRQTFVDRLVDETIENAIEQIFRLTVEQFFQRFIDEIFTDALSIVADLQISRRSLPMPTVNVDPMANFVENVAQRIFGDSFDSLREIFLNEQQSKD